jgi:hypothetical protein
VTASGDANNAAPVPATEQSKKPIWSDLLIKFAAELVVVSVVAFASAAWAYFSKEPRVPVATVVFAACVILASYLALRGFNYFSPNPIPLKGKARLHLTLFSVLAGMVLSPIPWYVNSHRQKRFTDQLVKLQSDLQADKQSQTLLDRKRIQIYVQVTDALQATLRKPHIDGADLTDLLHFCIESILLTKRNVHDVRAAVFYLDKTRQYLVVPPDGYYGYALDQDIRDLYFKVSPKDTSETDEAYLYRLGVAGWCFVNKVPINSKDVAVAGQPFRYKTFAASQKEEPDRAMICIPIPAISSQKPGQYVGVLAVSSLSAGVLTENDAAIARFFATLLGRFNTALDPPGSSSDLTRE